MASNGVNAIGAPRFPETDAPQTGADLEEITDYAAFRGTRMVGTNAEMLQFAADGFVKDGDAWFNTTDWREYRGKGGVWIPAARVATFTYLSNGVPDATLIGSGLLTAVGTETNDAGFITAITGSRLTLQAGLYSFAFSMALGAGVSAAGRTFVEALGAGLSQRGNAPIGEDRWGVSGVYYAPTDGVNVTFNVFKTTGGLANLSGHLRVVRLG